MRSGEQDSQKERNSEELLYIHSFVLKHLKEVKALRNKRKLLSLIMTVAMITTLFVGLTISASAYTATGTMSSLKTTTGFNTAATNGVYSINSATELGYLQEYVDGGYATSGRTFYLTQNITLSGSWTPIGDSSNRFEGTFDGCNNTISSMSISYIDDQDGDTNTNDPRLDYYGLFGYSTGPILNLTVNGEIDLSDVPSSVTIGNVGGIVGYTTSDVYNCHTNVTITAGRATKVGGVVGQISRTDTAALSKPYHVQACSAKGNITGLSRVGGVVGNVECSVAGNVIVDNCFYSNGTSTRGALTTTNTSSKVWSGGVVGYNMGTVSNCYAVASITRAGGHYFSGAVGILNGSNPTASLSNTYAAASISGGSTSYDRPIFGSCDNSNTMAIKNCLYDSTLAGSYTQPIATGANGWGYWNKVGKGTTAQLQGTGNVTAYSSTGSSYTTNTSQTALQVLGDAFTSDSTTPVNTGYPVLKWQLDSSKLPTYVAGVPGSVSSESGIFVNGVSGNDSYDGTTRAKAVKTISRALTLAGTSTIIYVTDTVSLGASELNLTAGDYTGAITRSAAFTGDLFSVPSGVSATIANVAINGNKNNVNAFGSLIAVEGGTLSISTSATFTANHSYDGGAVNVKSGTLNMSAGTLSSNVADRGGAVYVCSGAYFYLSGGNIRSNTAVSTGGAVCSRGTFQMSGGTLGGTSLGNTADNGGAIAVMAGTTTLTSAVSSSAITGNTATYGAGVYENADATFNYAGTGIASDQVVYLANTNGNSDAYITLAGAVSSSGIEIETAHPFINQIVVQSDGTYSISNPDKDRVSSADEDYYVDLASGNLVLKAS